ncbi:MAG: acetyl-CoA carboxylase biotin carboxyl carrier protein [Treponema sp.]|jgi:acetyl-CoA carboxylase biotin carboxyl carrier protein|nr:acetyl-CoA carboxylase biotin carboxyl carrier protein [Treponema sp.]
MKDEFILALIDRLEKSGLAELEYSDGASRLVLRKQPLAETARGAAPAGVHGAAADGMNAGAESADSPPGSDVITSPIVGTFYPAPSPDSPPFVRAGSRVKAGDTLCILEAMKMMNHLEAEFDCEIIAVKAASGDLVEYGQTLFEVKKA